MLKVKSHCLADFVKLFSIFRHVKDILIKKINYLGTEIVEQKCEFHIIGYCEVLLDYQII